MAAQRDEHGQPDLPGWDRVERRPSSDPEGSANRRSPRRCRGLRWRRAWTDHWAVIVPFMSGWTSQMKLYVPAASAGTS